MQHDPSRRGLLRRSIAIVPAAALMTATTGCISDSNHSVSSANGLSPKQHKGLESGEIRFESLPSKTFFGFLLQNTKEGYLSDPIHGGNKNAAAWAMIGFPGARADYADWVGPPGVRYRLPPTTINGPQG
jgi:hypothetical protein